MTNATRKWIRAGLETLIQGGTAAVGSSFTAAVIDPKDWGFFTSNSWKMIGGTFALNGIVRFVQWWNAHPLPEEGDTTMVKPDGTSVTSRQVVSLNPLTQSIITK